MAASPQLEALQTLLREQGLGSALLAGRGKSYPPAAATGLPGLDARLGGGLPRGQITEVVGAACSGCTSLVFSLLAGATERREVTAYVDASDCFDPLSAEKAGVVLDRLLWVRCGSRAAGFEKAAPRKARVDQAWQAINLVASAGGFGVIVLDLGGLPRRKLREWQSRPWLRLRRAIEHSATALVILAPEHLTSSVSALVLELSREKTYWSGRAGVSLLLDGISTGVRVLHRRRLTG